MSIELARERLTHLFQFFKAVEERRTPKVVDVKKHQWVMWLESLPKHSKLNLITPSPDSGEWLVVQKPILATCPPFPDVLNEWLETGWDDPSYEQAPKINEQTIRRGNDYEVVTFDHSIHRINAYSEWSQKRALWRSIELPARQVGRIWDRFFSLYNDLKRDGEIVELMLGDGIVSFKGQTEPIFYPLILRKVELFFDPSKLEFKLIDSESNPELYSSIFSADEFAGLPLKNWQSSLEQGNFHPLQGEILDHWLKGIAGIISKGEFINSMPIENSPNFCVGRSPVLFLRHRPTGKIDFIDKILADIPTAESFSSSLNSIVGLFQNEETSEENVSLGTYSNEHEDILLTKPANAEQVEILRKLSKRDGVLVQGPPGTGKTHTIANLIGNFLAEGKSVLVTSHTTKALRVVRDQVEKPLQSLCVSLLDSDAKGRTEREIAVRELAARLSDNPDQYKAEAQKLKKRRSEILEDLKKSRSEMLLVVGSEYIPIVLAGKEIEPSQAAKEVAAGLGLHDWIPGVIHDSAPLPISDSEVRQIYEISRRISVSEEAELSEALPKLSSLPSDEIFKEKVDEFNELLRSDLSYRRDLWNLPKGNSISLEEICAKVIEQVRYVQEMRKDSWKLAVLQAGLEGGANAEVWTLLCQNIKELRIQSQTATKYIFEHGPKLASHIKVEEQLLILTQIDAHFQKSTSISWAKRMISGWGASIDAWRVGNRSPQTCEEFISLKKFAELLIARQKLIDRWARLMCPIGVSPLTVTDLNPEDFAYQFVDQINVLLGWYSLTWQPLEKSLVDQGLDWKRLLSEAPQSSSVHHIADRLSITVENLLPPVLAAEDRRRRSSKLEIQFAQWVSYLNEIQLSRSHSSLVVSGVINAITNRSNISFQSEIRKLADLLAKIPDYVLRESLLKKLLPFANDWVSILVGRQDHITPDIKLMDASVAWRWSQLSQELKRRESISLENIQEKIRRQTDDLQKVTVEVVEKLSWAGLLTKVTNEQRQALLGWSAYIKKIGAGSGKLVPALERQAQAEMEKARGAVPVWIMPFSRVTRSFHPTRDKFDVIIIDEASQEDVLGLVPLYMAKKVIVVGDDEQVTPLDVGGLQEPIQQLINQWLVDLPSFTLFDLKTSVYDRAQIAFGSAIRLKEHFRCVPEIIQFSNSLCYNYTIKPLRESASTIVKPALVAHRVQGYSDGKVNKTEAQEIVDLIRACIEQPEYEGKTIGVISMVGDKQTDLISDMLRAKLPPAVYDHRRILCGNPAQFQGDERDIIFLSLVDSKDDGHGPMTLRQDGADGMYKKRFNVASSRAKDQLWVVYSMDVQTQLKSTDIRRRLIEHAIDPSSLMNQLNAGLVKTESPFEAEVFKILSGHGYKVTPQWQVGAYRIDLVAEGNGKRLAIECDGDRWHYDKFEEDLARQALLERLGWTFVRIRGSVFYRDKTQDRQLALRPLFQKLQELGIEANYESNSLSLESEKHTLSERVKQKVYEFRTREATSVGQTISIEDAINHIESNSVISQPLVKTLSESKVNETPVQFSLFNSKAEQSSTNEPNIHLQEQVQFVKGDRVYNQKYGHGTVVGVKKFGGKARELVIDFDFCPEEKTMLVTGVQLT